MSYSMTLYDFKDRILGHLLETYWTIGFSAKKSVRDYTFDDIQWISYDATDSWYADPFILDYDDKTIALLVEEFPHTTGIARISKLVIDREQLVIKKAIPLIEEPTHLSFPAILRGDDGIYVYPESCRSGKLSVYKLNEDTSSCEKLGVIAEGSYADTILFNKGDKYYMLTTLEPGANGKDLYVFESDGALGGYSLRNKLVLDGNEARNAGDVIEEDGQLYKISQDNNSSVYGYGVVFHEMDAEFNLKRVNHIVPKGKYIGVHTMNHYHDLVVWDGKKYVHPHLAKVVNWMLKVYQTYIKK